MPAGDRPMHGLTTQSRNGFALPVAIFALVVVGVLVTGGFYMARQETRIGVASERGTAAFYLAERGAMEVMSQWDLARFGSLANWASATSADTVDEGSWEVQVTRMGPRMYFLLATGTVSLGSATLGDASRILGLVTRLTTAEIMPDAALTTVGNLTVGGSSWVVGHDSIPTGWGSYCGSPGASKPGILIDDLSNIKTVGTSFGIEGDPPQAQDPSLTSESLLEFGDLAWADLVALADIVIPSGTTVTTLAPDSVLVGGSYVCRTGLPRNWGDPMNPAGVCGNHFPIIYATGNLNINSNDEGQGILLVEGDLAVQGRHPFPGPALVTGDPQPAGPGGHFVGGVIAANVNLDTSTVLGNALVQFSTCAVTRAVLNNSALTRVRPLARRSWVDLSSVVSG